MYPWLFNSVKMQLDVSASYRTPLLQNEPLHRTASNQLIQDYMSVVLFLDPMATIWILLLWGNLDLFQPISIHYLSDYLSWYNTLLRVFLQSASNGMQVFICWKFGLLAIEDTQHLPLSENLGHIGYVRTNPVRAMSCPIDESLPKSAPKSPMALLLSAVVHPKISSPFV